MVLISFIPNNIQYPQRKLPSVGWSFLLPSHFALDVFQGFLVFDVV